MPGPDCTLHGGGHTSAAHFGACKLARKRVKHGDAPRTRSRLGPVTGSSALRGGKDNFSVNLATDLAAAGHIGLAHRSSMWSFVFRDLSRRKVLRNAA
jgi:hypothetical protein